MSTVFVSPFSNDPFAMVCQAYKNLYGNPFRAMWGEHDEDGQGARGFTNFADGDIPTVVVYADCTVFECVETFAHELAHVAVGAEHDHDNVWLEAFEAIRTEYDRLGRELCG